MAFTPSPLFQAASRQIQEAARRQFRQSDFGRLVTEIDRAARSPSPQRKVREVFERMKSAARPENAIRQLMGADLGGLAREIERYAKGSVTTGRAVQQLLSSLGPAGKLLGALASPGKTGGMTRDLKAAMDLIQALGGEVLPGKQPQWKDLADVERALQTAHRRLQDYGFEVVGAKGPLRRLPEPEEGRTTLDVERGLRPGTMRMPANHPLVTGEMVGCPSSSNVYEFGYDIDAAYLYVRFQGRHEEGARGSAGPMYRYSGVTAEEFLGLYRVRNQGGGNGPGAWVWDALRIRGTVSGHQKDYELVGIMGGYVPRKATVKPTYRTHGKRGQPLTRPKKTGVEEWYVQRRVKTHEGRFVQSVLPTARVMPVRR